MIDGPMTAVRPSAGAGSHQDRGGKYQSLWIMALWQGPDAKERHAVLRGHGLRASGISRNAIGGGFGRSMPGTLWLVVGVDRLRHREREGGRRPATRGDGDELVLAVRVAGLEIGLEGLA